LNQGMRFIMWKDCAPDKEASRSEESKVGVSEFYLR
jgi:hypothetical protein